MLNLSKSIHFKKETLFIILFFVLSFIIILLFYILGNPNRPPWLDEAMSYLFSKEKKFIYNGKFEQYTLISDTHPPFYYLLLKFWIFLVGKNFFLLRFLSLIFSFLTAIIIYIICDFYTTQKSIKILAVITFLLNPLVNIQSNNLRMYTLLVFLLSLSYLLLIYYMKTPKNVYLILLTITTVLALYTHYFSIFTLLGIGFIEIYSYITHRMDKNTFFSLLIKDFIAIVTFLPWFIYKVLIIIEYNNTRWNWIPNVSIQGLISIFANLFYNYIFFLLVLILVISSFFILGKNESLKLLYIDMMILSFFTFFIPLTTSTFKIILDSSIMMDYYLIFLTVPFAILFSSSVTKLIMKVYLKLKLNNKKQLIFNSLFILLIAIFLVFIPSVRIYNLNASYPRYDQLVPILLEDNSSAILISPRGFNILLYYLPDSYNTRLFTVSYANSSAQAFISVIQSIKNNFSTIWYIKHKYYNPQTENSTLIVKYLNGVGTRITYFRDNNGLLEAWKYSFS